MWEVKEIGDPEYAELWHDGVFERYIFLSEIAEFFAQFDRKLEPVH